MALKFRRGTTAQQSGSLAFGEPYVNTTLGTLVVGGANGDIVLSATGTGSTGNFGAISGSGLDITGNANIAGNVTIGGQLQVGDQTSDTVNVVASLSSSLIPSATNAFDLGSATRIWRDLYISTGSIKFVAGTTVVKEVTLSTITGLEAATGSSNTSIANLNAATASLNTSISNINTYTASVSTSILNINAFSASENTKSSTLGTYTGSVDTKFTTLSTYTASVDTKFTTLSTTTGSYDTRHTTIGSYTSSLETRMTAVGTATGSLNTSVTNLNLTTASLNTSVTNLNTTTASLNTSVTNLNSYTSSLNTAIAVSGADLTVKGNLLIQGSQSVINSTTLQIGDNIIQLNGTGATNAGLVVRDATAATTVSGSLLWDTTNDKWIAGPLGSEDDVVLRTLGQTLTNKTISGASNTLSNIANSSLTNSSITIAGTSVSLGGSITAATILNGTGVVSGSSQVDVTATTNYSVITGQFSGVQSATSSLNTSVSNINTFTASASGRLNNLETTSASVNTSITNINSFSASQNTKSSTLATVTGSYDTRFTTLGTLTGSYDTRFTTLATTTGSYDTRFTTLGPVTSSLNTFSSSQLTQNSTLATYTSSLETRMNAVATATGSLNTSVTNLNLTTASLNTSVSNINSFTASQLTQNTSLATVTGSLISSASNLTQRVAANEAVSGTFARTNSANTFTGNQIVSGSLTVTQDFVVLGSSSIQNISSSTLNIGTNLITVAVNQPSVRFGGFAVIDSGSAGQSGSLLYDSVEDEFIFVHRAISGSANITSSHFLMGPETINNLGNETYLTNNRVPKGTGKEHLNDSNITDSGTLITLGSNTQVNGTFFATGTTLVSGSAQISGTGITNNTITIAGTSTALGGAITLATITGNTGIVSGSSQITSLLPAGTISGSSQVDATATTNWATGIKTQLNSNTVVSGSSQVISILTSLNTYTASNDTTNTSQNTSITNLNSFSASALTRLTNLETETSNLELTTASLNTSVSNLNSYTSSFPTATVSLSNKTLVTPTIAAVGGDEGGQVDLALAVTNQTLTGSVSFDIWRDRFRIFEGGGTNRGVFLQISSASATVGSELIINNGTQTLTNKTISGASNTLSNIGNASLTNSSITIAGTSISLGGSITAATILQGTGVISGSSQLTTDFDSRYLNTNGDSVVSGSSQISHDSTTGYSANRHIDHTAVSITAGSGLNGGGDISSTRTLSVNSGSMLPYYTSSVFSTITGDITISSTGTATIAANSVALGTDTTGDYVASLVAGTGVTLSNNSGEGATPTIAIGQSVATSASPTFAGLSINGAITATGDITAFFTSDKRHKNNIQIIPNALQKVSKLNGVTWEWNDDVNEVTKSTPKTGLIAQEVQEVLPEVVREREDGFLSLDYSKMMGLLVEAIKEQQTHIHNLTLQIEELKKQKGL